MDAQERREARLSRRRERERKNRALESPEEREARLARRRVRDRALRAAQSTAQREEALQRRRSADSAQSLTYVRIKIQYNTVHTTILCGKIHQSEKENKAEQIYK